MLERRVTLLERNVLTISLDQPSEGVAVSVIRSPIQLGRVVLSQDWLPIDAEHALDISVTALVSPTESEPIVTLHRTDSKGVSLAIEGGLALTSVEPGAHGRCSLKFQIRKSFLVKHKGRMYFQVRATSSSWEVTSGVLDVEVLKPLLQTDWDAQRRFEREMMDEFARLRSELGPQGAAQRVFELVKSNVLVRSAKLQDYDNVISIEYKSGEIGALMFEHPP